jgi:formate hydrogenlyase subunit 6/NADH:ubiquinone oxidoreductase subunit I
MPLWFARGLRRGIVTTHYPARPDSSAADLPTPPAFRAAAIDRRLADLLATVCPSQALHRDGDVLLFDVGQCTACGRCQEAAPWAVTPSGEFELAGTSRAQFVKKIELVQEVDR